MPFAVSVSIKSCPKASSPTLLRIAARPPRRATRPRRSRARRLASARGRLPRQPPARQDAVNDEFAERGDGKPVRLRHDSHPPNHAVQRLSLRGRTTSRGTQDLILAARLVAR